VPSLLELGFERIGIDGGWMACGAGVGGSWHTAAGRPLVNETLFPKVVCSDKHTKLAQKLGQLQHFLAVFPQKCMDKLAYFGQPNTFLACGCRRCVQLVQRARRRQQRHAQIGAALSFCRDKSMILHNCNSSCRCIIYCVISLFNSPLWCYDWQHCPSDGGGAAILQNIYRTYDRT
jgi:hypothetical protein